MTGWHFLAGSQVLLSMTAASTDARVMPCCRRRPPANTCACRTEPLVVRAELCPLCRSKGAAPLFKGGKASGNRDFLHCNECDLVFVPRAQLLDAAGQKARYLQHNNEVDDPAYREFLGRMYYALRPHLNAGAKGLDYGAGPGTRLAADDDRGRVRGKCL